MHTSFLPFVKKETLHVLRDPRTMTIVLVIPIILMVLFGFAISMEVNNVNVVAVVPVPGTETRTILDRVAHNQYMNFVGTISPDEVDEVLRRGTADAVIVFDRNTPVHINLVMDASRTSTVQSAAMYLRNIISENSGNGGTVGMSLRTLYNPQLKSAYNFVPGIMGMLFLLICCMMTSVSIVREKETGTMEVLLVSPVRPQRIIMAAARAVLFAFVCRAGYYFEYCLRPVGTAVVIHRIQCHLGVAAVHIAFAGYGRVCVRTDLQADSGTADFRNAVYAAGVYALRNDFSRRKYARATAMGFYDNTRAMVCRRYTQDDD